MAEAADAIISIHRSYADAILAGTKTIELRRKLPDISSGTRLWIYATRPTGAVVGVATIKAVDRAPPATIWKKHRDGTGIDHAAFQDYFDGAPEAIAILLTAVRRIGPIDMDQLRRIRDCFHPPQVLTRLTVTETKALRKLVAA
ncbi:MAG TPA: ASCH domain-containing protein [Rhizomicrobium sp.]|nr:ASCH domain-containing protein [Rhizomicrobium sp.]